VTLKKIALLQALQDLMEAAETLETRTRLSKKFNRGSKLKRKSARHGSTLTAGVKTVSQPFTLLRSTAT